MAELQIDPFVSTEPEVELDSETWRILHERMASADEGRLVSAEEAREHIRQWLSNSSITKTL
jgi:predicted transcriptional regulator